ncbi:MAG: hypothetical protein Q4C68_07175 [Moraxella sp.]|nr:hypothetical protein [Moraxella sp.]
MKKINVTEMFLEFVQEEDGRLVLRESRNKNEMLVAIDFGEKIKGVLGEDTHFIGEHMIQAAMAAVMSRQVERWHAHIYDEEPAHYS